MRTWIRRIAILVFIISFCIHMPYHHNRAFSFAPEDELMKIKGYSPMMVKLVETQRSKQEWRDSGAPVLTPAQRFVHNIYYNNWTGSMDAFGSEQLRERE